MLTKSQVDEVWNSMFKAEVRSYYYGDLASRYTRWKKVLTGSSFLLSSIAVALVVGGAEGQYIFATLNLIIAATSGFSIGFSLDENVARMSRLRHSWSQVADEYERLWNRWYEEPAEHTLLKLQQQARLLSDEGIQAPRRQKLLAYWYDQVCSMHPEMGRTATTVA